VDRAAMLVNFARFQWHFLAANPPVTCRVSRNRECIIWESSTRNHSGSQISGCEKNSIFPPQSCLPATVHSIGKSVKMPAPSKDAMEINVRHPAHNPESTIPTEDLHDSRPSPRTESLVASAVQWAERIMRRIDGTFASSADDKRWLRA
jgi:hypothetical protein